MRCPLALLVTLASCSSSAPDPPVWPAPKAREVFESITFDHDHFRVHGERDTSTLLGLLRVDRVDGYLVQLSHVQWSDKAGDWELLRHDAPGESWHDVPHPPLWVNWGRVLLFSYVRGESFPRLR